jgi:hypothetical protein
MSSDDTSSPPPSPAPTPVQLPYGINIGKGMTNHITFNAIVNKVVSILKSIDNVDTLKNHPEIVNTTCCIIEWYIPNNTFKFDKKQMAVQVLDLVFGHTDQEKEDIATQVEFQYINGLIKPTPFYKIIYAFLVSLFKIRAI